MCTAGPQRPDRMPEDMPGRMPDRMPEDMPEDMPGRMPEDMPDRISDRMPGDMSDRMPEDLPVTKWINVMVGFTRSKAILFFLQSKLMSLCFDDQSLYSSVSSSADIPSGHTPTYTLVKVMMIEH